MANIFTQFLALLPKESLEVGTVIAATATGAAVQLMGGGIVQARGEATLGQRVFVRAGVIEGPAPTLTYVTAEI
jgi:hypothetical protein